MSFTDMLLGGIFGYSLRSSSAEQEQEKILTFAKRMGVRMIFQAISGAAEDLDELAERKDCSRKCISLTLLRLK